MSKKKNKINPNAWMVTFGDLIMLLLTFFVLLLTMKSMDKEVTEEMFQHFIADKTFIIDDQITGPGSENAPPGVIKQKKTYISSSAKLQKTLRQDYDNIIKTGTIKETDKGVVITLASENLFASGSATILQNGIQTLNTVGHLLERISNDIIILGHTDNIKMAGGQYKSNWELSCYRALSVIDYFTDHYDIQSESIAAGGFGPTKPLVPNTSPINRAKNRRVEIILKK